MQRRRLFEKLALLLALGVGCGTACDCTERMRQRAVQPRPPESRHREPALVLFDAEAVDVPRLLAASPLLWRQPVADARELVTTANRVLIVAQDRVLWFDIASGEAAGTTALVPRAQAAGSDFEQRTPSIASLGSIVLANTTPWGLQALDSASGAPLWWTACMGDVGGVKGFTLGDHVVVDSLRDERAQEVRGGPTRLGPAALDPRTGEVAWARRPRYVVLPGEDPVLPKEVYRLLGADFRHVYLSLDHDLVAVNADGALAWQASCGDRVHSWCERVDSDGRWVVASRGEHPRKGVVTHAR